ncbi:MAG: class I SAM-dependent methyltransferase, partial [Pseudomonadales bacterium]|nr:class I SAM-dependent methyltransferase [Pseudomonadales bacterium]
MTVRCYLEQPAFSDSDGYVSELLELPECAPLDSIAPALHATVLRLQQCGTVWQFLLPGDNARQDGNARQGGNARPGGHAKVSIDFSQPAIVRRLAANNWPSEYVVRAVRGRRGPRWRQPLQVLDATAGLGTDSMLLAASGCEVLLAEKIP